MADNNVTHSVPSPVPSDTRTRRVSHRKVIIHNDGDICLRTYNKVCPHDDDPGYEDPPMHHEMEGQCVCTS